MARRSRRSWGPDHSAGPPYQFGLPAQVVPSGSWLSLLWRIACLDWSVAPRRLCPFRVWAYKGPLRLTGGRSHSEPQEMLQGSPWGPPEACPQPHPVSLTPSFLGIPFIRTTFSSSASGNPTSDTLLRSLPRIHHTPRVCVPECTLIAKLHPFAQGFCSGGKRRGQVLESSKAGAVV